PWRVAGAGSRIMQHQKTGGGGWGGGGAGAAGVPRQADTSAMRVDIFPSDAATLASCEPTGHNAAVVDRRCRVPNLKAHKAPRSKHTIRTNYAFMSVCNFLAVRDFTVQILPHWLQH